MQEAKTWELPGKKKIYISPRFSIKDISKMCGISSEEIEEIQSKEKLEFSSAYILMDSERLPFLTATVMDFFIQEIFIKVNDLQSLVAVINKIGEIKMDTEDRQTFQEKMIEFRKRLVQKMKHEKQKEVFDETLSDAQFQDLLIGSFYYSYMMKVCSKDDRKYLEKAEENQKECFEAAAKIFKVTFKIYEVSKEGLMLANTITAPSGKNFSVIYLIFFKNVFIQINAANSKTPNVSPSASQNIHASSKNPKDWLKQARKSSVNPKLQRQHPRLTDVSQYPEQDSDEDLFIKKKKEAKKDFDQEGLEEFPRRPTKPKLDGSKSMKSSAALGEEDVENFKKFLENMIEIIMSSYTKLNQSKKDAVFDELNDYFISLKKTKFDSSILRDFKKTIKNSINKVLEEAG